MLRGRPFAYAFAFFATTLWILPPALFADRVGAPYRGPWELMASGSGQGTGDSGGTGGDSGGGGTGGDSGGSGGGDSGGGGTGGGDSGGGGAQPGGGVGGGGGGAGGPGGGGAALDGSRIWQWWWEHNKDRFLVRATERGRVNPGSAYYWFGSGAKYPPREIVPVSDTQRAQKVLDALRTALKDREMRVRAEAAIAIGRLGSVPVGEKNAREGMSNDWGVRELTGLLDRQGATSPQERDVRHSAILGLGMGAHPDGCDFLLKHLASCPADEKPWALIALGLARYLPAIPVFCDGLPKPGRAKPTDEQLACIHGLGLLGPDLVPEIEKKGGIKALEKLVGNSADPVTMQAVTALGRLQQSLKEVKGAYQTSKSKDIQWTAVLAMAAYARDEKDAADAAKTLATKCFKDGEGQIKNFSVLAAGDLASRLDPNSHVREYLVKHLRDVVEMKDNYVRACAAVALGVAGDRTAIPALMRMLEDPTCSDSAVAGACLGLGLLKATEATELLKTSVMLRTKWNDDARGYAALGLALMGDTTLIDTLKEFHARKDLNVKTLRQTPLALGVLGDRNIVKFVIEVFSKPWKQNERYVVSNAAFGLTWIRDESSVDLLADLATKNGDTDVRGLAVAALGYAAAREPVSPLARTIENVSHRNKFNWGILNEISQIL